MPTNPTPTTDRDALASEAYADDRYLAARQALYHWQSPRYDLQGLVIRELAQITGIVIDVGCGNGKFLKRLTSDRPDLQLVGMDIAPGILAGIPTPTVLGDAHQLPFADEVASAVLVAHMLYHVNDVACVLEEVRRVLKPGGIAIASTNSDSDKLELDDLWSLAGGDSLGVERGPRRISVSSKFSLEDAPEVLGRHFDILHTINLPGVIRVKDPEPVIAHLASYRAWSDAYGVPFDETLAHARRRLELILSEQGHFDINCLGGFIICQKAQSSSP